MAVTAEPYRIVPSPHMKGRESIASVMWTMVLVLLPAAGLGVYLYGKTALFLALTAAVTAVAAEALCQLALRRPVTVFDGSALITGLLLAMNLPPEAPLWAAAAGAAFAVVIAKQLFGGLGYNIFNPALAGLAFLRISWPAAAGSGGTNFLGFEGMNVLARDVRALYSLPDSLYDAVMRTTPLSIFTDGPVLFQAHAAEMKHLNDSLFGAQALKAHLFGFPGGGIGEASVLLLIAGAAVLLLRRIISWRIPVFFVATAGALSFAYYRAIGYPDPASAAFFQVCTGGLLLGALFMATDSVTSPLTRTGLILFGAGCGFFTFMIKIWGGVPGGIVYAILLMNAFVPLIDRLTRPAVFGAREAERGRKSDA